MTMQQPVEPPIDLPCPAAPFGVAYRRFWKKGFTFSGRASRSEFWLGYIGALAPLLAVYFFSLILTGIAIANYSSGTLGFASFLTVVCGLYAVAVIIPTIAAIVRRLHDANYSGAMYVVSLLPIVGGIIVLVMLAQPSVADGARFDAPQMPVLPQPAGRTVPPPPPPLPHAVPAVPPSPAAPAVPPPPAPVPPPAPQRHAPVSGPQPRVPVTAAPHFAHPHVDTPAAWPDAPGALDETRMSAPLQSAEWVAVLPDGRRLPLTAPMYVGRSPAAGPEHPGALLVPVDDPAKSMSKTHARLVPVDGGIEVTDLHSTNGTVAAIADERVALVPGVARRVDTATSFAFGDWMLELQRGAR